MKRLLVALLVAAAALAVLPASAAAVGIEYGCSPGPADCSGWHRTPVVLTWTATGGALQCAAQEQLEADGVLTRTCTATSTTGSATEAATIRIDRTPPVVTGATPSRPPESTGWYRSPVDVTFAGSDRTSGVAACTTATYPGPDSGDARVDGVCRDRAGNVSAPSGFTLRYDATAPAVAAPTAASGDRLVELSWQPPADAVAVDVVRSPGRDGAASAVIHTGGGTTLEDRDVRNGHSYDYTVRATDAAGNVATASTSATPGRRLLVPARRAVLREPPLLAWTPVRGARYYNVQLFRGKRKILSAWPRAAHFAMRSHWRYLGRRHQLRPGRYRWYAWPGRGHPREHRYGRLIGRGSFTIARG